MDDTDDEKFESIQSKHHTTRDSSKFVDAENEQSGVESAQDSAGSEGFQSVVDDPFTGSTIEQKQLLIRQLTQTEGCFESPIDVSISKAKEIQLQPLEWIHFDVPPKKIKVTNTGLSVILSAKWKQERPYIQGGPFIGKYVFSNWHLHWGKNAMEGSEHLIDGVKYPAEMHVVTFKSSYLTQEAALKEQDGCATLVYLFKLQDAPNPDFQCIVEALKDIKNPGTSKKIETHLITNLVRIFTEDYLMYWGAVSTQKCTHYVMWLITRVPIGISAEQVDALRFVLDNEGKMLTRNFRDQQELHNRSIFHVCPSSSKYATLLPLPDGPPIAQIYRCEVHYENSDQKIENTFNYAIEIKKPM